MRRSLGPDKIASGLPQGCIRTASRRVSWHGGAHASHVLRDCMTSRPVQDWATLCCNTAQCEVTGRARVGWTPRSGQLWTQSRSMISRQRRWHCSAVASTLQHTHTHTHTSHLTTLMAHVQAESLRSGQHWTQRRSVIWRQRKWHCPAELLQAEPSCPPQAPAQRPSLLPDLVRRRTAMCQLLPCSSASASQPPINRHQRRGAACCQI